MTDKEIEVIVKPIFTKMFNANFSACEYGIECYKKGMEYQGIKELAIENDNLIKRVEKLEKENAELKNRNQELLESCEGATMMYKDLQKAKDNLTKATELLRKLVLEVKGYEEINGYDTCEPVQEAEQFLKDQEEANGNYKG